MPPAKSPLLKKKCRHGRGLTGPARQRAWRRCGCAWVADLHIDGRRCFVPLGADEQRARVAFTQLVADREAKRLRTGGAASMRLDQLAERWLAEASLRLKPAT